MPIKNKIREYKKKKVESSSSDSESSSSSESDSEYRPTSTDSTEDTETTVYTECSSEEEVEEEFDENEFKHAIAKLFPSKYSKDRAKESAREKRPSKKPRRKNKVPEFESESESEEEEASHPPKTKKSKNKKTEKKSSSKKNRHRKPAKSESDSSASDAEYTEDEDPENAKEEGRFNLILNVGGLSDELDYEDEEDEVVSLVEDATEEFDSDAEKTFMGAAYEPISSKSQEKPKKPSRVKSPSAKEGKNSPKNESGEKEKELHKIPEDIEEEYKEMLEVKKILSDQLKRRPNNEILKKSLKKCNEGIKKLARKARHANTNAYYKLLNSERKQTDEIDYFKHRLSNKEQQGIMSDLKEINKTIYSEKPHRLTLLQSKIPTKFKTVAMQRLNMLKSMDQSDHEYYKIKNWVDAFMRIPFGIYRSVDIKMSDGIDVCGKFMENAKKTLDECVYGLNDAKLQIMQMLGQWVVNPNSIGTSIAIHGPPGTGKTSIVKDGISKILGREFAFIALGGCGDGAFLEGHSYTYEGSMWGKIAQILMECKSMNPIIYFDELDKVSDSARGQEIIGILTHLTDTTQNTEFHDTYFSEERLD